MYGKPTQKDDDVAHIMQAWSEKKGQKDKLRRKKAELPSDRDPNFTYGLSTQVLDEKQDPFLRSSAVIEQRQAHREKELAKQESKPVKPKKKIDPTKPTAASLGHTKKPEGEPQLKDTFKMKRFTQFEHGKIDTGLKHQAKEGDKPEGKKAAPKNSDN